MKENMYCQRTSQQGKGNSCWEEGSHLLSSKRKDHKVLNILNLAPGPGSYRLPSDFGQYDEALHPSMVKSEMIKTGRTTSTSHVKRE